MNGFILRQLTNLLLLCGLVFPVQGQYYAWHPVTEAEAIQAVRNFEQDQNLAVTVVLLPRTQPVGRDPQGYFKLSASNHEYILPEDTLDQLVMTDARIAHIEDFYGHPFDPVVLAPLVIGQDEAQAIADAYMRCHYPNPNRLAGVYFEGSDQGPVSEPVTEPHWIQNYRFVFYEDLGSGVKGPAMCWVSVDTILKQVVQYSQRTFPVFASPTPLITGNQAMAAGVSASGVVNYVPEEVRTLEMTAPDDFGVETLMYTVLFSGSTPPGMSSRYEAHVDGYTGYTYGCVTLTGSPSVKAVKPWKSAAIPIGIRRASRVVRPGKLKTMIGSHEARMYYPSFLIGHTPFIYVRYLGCNDIQSRPAYRSPGTVTLKVDGRSIEFTRLSRVWSINDSKFRLSEPPVILNSRLYVPLEAAQSVMRFDIRYDAKAKVIHMTPGIAAAHRAAIGRMN